MKTSPITLGVLAVALGFSAAAAQDTTQVRTDMAAPALVGAWELIEIDGSTLPVTAEETAECTETITAGTLSLEEGGAWAIELIELETCGTDAEEDTETEEGDFVLDGETIDFRPGEDEGLIAAADSLVEEVEEEVQEETDEEELDHDELVSGTFDGETIRALTRGGAELVFRKVQM